MHRAPATNLRISKDLHRIVFPQTTQRLVPIFLHQLTNTEDVEGGIVISLYDVRYVRTIRRDRIR